MKHVFSDLEGLRIAIEMEKRGAELYRHAARVSRRPEVVALVHRLERDELDHQREFSAHYERLRDAHVEAEPYAEESSAYLAAVAADVVFPGGLVEMASHAIVDGPAAILRRAIQSEKDSILFYGEMIERAQSEAARRAFADIVTEERRHMQELIDMLMEVAP
ncbi:ferritin family protein [Bacillota bacterium Meth-B3]